MCAVGGVVPLTSIHRRRPCNREFRDSHAALFRECSFEVVQNIRTNSRLLPLHGPSDAWHRFLAIQREAENFRQSLFARLPSNPQALDIVHSPQDQVLPAALPMYSESQFPQTQLADC